MQNQASILVGLLWCLALLSIVVIGLLHTARLDLMVVKNHGDRIQAHYLALAGVEKAKALLYHDMLDRRGTGKNHTKQLYDDPKEFREVAFSRGKFRVFRPGQSEEEEGIVFGVSDEESRLNVNLASPEELAKLQGMTPDVVAAILDWRDGDNAVTPSGAEAEYYASVQPPYLPRNGLFQTIRELLMVRGVTTDLLLGDNVASYGLPEFGEDSRSAQSAPSNPGWSGMLSVNSSVENLNASGKDRINIKSADENSLSSIKGISSQLAKAIVAYRNQKQFESIADLLDVAEIQNQPGQPPPSTTTTRTTSTRSSSTRSSSSSRSSSSKTQTSPSSRPAAPTGPRLISENLFIEIADDVTVESDSAQEGLININTASLNVLVCLEGMERELAQAIISYRKSNGFFQNVAALLKVSGMNTEIFKQIAPRLTARSETFRIMSEGKVTSTGARQGIEVIVHISKYDIKTLSYREDL